MFSTKSIHSVTRDSFDPRVPFAATVIGVRTPRTPVRAETIHGLRSHRRCSAAAGIAWARWRAAALYRPGSAGRGRRGLAALA